MWSYAESLEWLYARQALGIKLGLQKVRDLLHAIGDPQVDFAAVHVAGTNGKGSVVHFIADALHRSGHRVGTFTSPHLVRFTERITVDGAVIDEDAVAEGLAAIKPAVDHLDAAGTPPTFFEVNTALAFWHFSRQGVQWAVVETGMGGRLDATNVLAPRLTVVTNVARDHGSYLGEDLADVAFEKAGILKEGVPCVTGAADGPLVVLKGVSRERRVPMSVLGEDYHVVPDVNGMRLVHPGGDAHYDVAMAGEHQLHNAALAVAACDALRAQGVEVAVDAVQQALATVQVPGRLESFHVHAGQLAASLPGVTPPAAGDRRIEVLLDGAHNLAGAQALRFHLGRRDWTGFHLVTGFAADKDWTAMLQQWVPLAAHVWAAPLRSPRGLDPAHLRAEVVEAGIPFDACPDVRSALFAAAQAGAERIVAAGSLWLVGEARAVLEGETLEEVQGVQ